MLNPHQRRRLLAADRSRNPLAGEFRASQQRSPARVANAADFSSLRKYSSERKAGDTACHAPATYPRESALKIRAGYDIAFQCVQEMPMVLMLSVHPSRQPDLLTEHVIRFSPGVASRDYRDAFGNICTRLVAPPGLIEIKNEFIIEDSGLPDEVAPNAEQWSIDVLPDEALIYLIGSRYCDTEKLSDLAWSQFGGINGGWQRVQAICDYVHNHIEFGYHHARCDRTASEGHAERIGVCRDFAHLAVTLCRCMNIPARYCTGYLGDIGVPKDPAPMDFSAWFEVFLAGRWFTFDARHNRPRIGRIVMARGRDAADVAISTAFGPAQLARFNVVTEELADKDYSPRNLQNQPSPDPVGRWAESAKSPAPCGAGNLAWQ
jgi:transglutaminase-like putative cysteine protease